MFHGIAAVALLAELADCSGNRTPSHSGAPTQQNHRTFAPLVLTQPIDIERSRLSIELRETREDIRSAIESTAMNTTDPSCVEELRHWRDWSRPCSQIVSDQPSKRTLLRSTGWMIWSDWTSVIEARSRSEQLCCRSAAMPDIFAQQPVNSSESERQIADRLRVRIDLQLTGLTQISQAALVARAASHSSRSQACRDTFANLYLSYHEGLAEAGERLEEAEQVRSIMAQHGYDETGQTVQRDRFLAIFQPTNAAVIESCPSSASVHVESRPGDCACETFQCAWLSNEELLPEMRTQACHNASHCQANNAALVKFLRIQAACVQGSSITIAELLGNVGQLANGGVQQ